MMTNAQLAAASFDDIVFDGRNKGYGAYELRRLYQRHVSRALAIATTIFALLVFYPVVAAYLEGPVIIAPVKKLVIAKPMVLPDDPIIPVLPPPPVPVAVTPPPPPVATARLTEFRVVRNEQASEELPSIDELKGKAIGTQNTAGVDPATASLPELPPVAGPATVGPEVVSSAPYISVEQMPELPGGGGLPAIVAAIQKSVKYPARAISAGVEGKVYVSFVVNAKGEVVDVKVIKGLGAGLDEETIRAINLLPRFIPGKQNGREVSVSYSVPITFKIQ